jgi:SAM-dependent methyltransferase
MIDRLKPVTTASRPCKICGNAAALFGVVDFHKRCLQDQIRLPLSGVPVYYRRCDSCGFLFTDAFDDWSTDEFKAYIYNDDYRLFDPEYLGERPRANADNVKGLWSQYKAGLRVLDFGGGNDVFCATLRADGFLEAVTYDPMTPEFAQRPDGKFDLVTCFETLEHLPDPLAGIECIVGSLAEPGLCFFTTLVQPPDFNTQGLNWWYASPRNGHISLFSRQSLALAWGRHDYKLISHNDNVHFAFRTLPSYVALRSQ